MDNLNNIGLTDIFSMYQKEKGYKKEAYGTLYKMLGGKKEVPEYSLEMYWYLCSLERMNRVYNVYRERLLEFEKEKKDIKTEEELDKKQKEYNLKVFDFFKSRFQSCLDYLTHCYKLKSGVKQVDLVLAYWITLPNGHPLVNRSIILNELYAIGEIHKALIDIFVSLKGYITGSYPVIEEMNLIMNDISSIFKHTNLKIILPEVNKK